MELERISDLTGVKHIREIPVTKKELDAWKASGVHIQNYFPQLTADDREFILTGVTPEEWEDAFGDEDEEDEEAARLWEKFDEFFPEGDIDIVVEKDK